MSPDRKEGRSRVTIGRADAPRGAVDLGGRTRIIAPIAGATPDALAAEIAALPGHPVDLVEWRVDPLLAALPLRPGSASIDEAGTARSDGAPRGDFRATALAAIEAVWTGVVSACPLPVLATIRTSAEGGEAALDSGDYAELVARLAGLADAVDVEIGREGSEEIIAAARERGAVVVSSAHDFAATPASDVLLSTLEAMDAAGAEVLKIACWANDAADTARVLAVQAEARSRFGRPVIAIAMGGAGALTRFAGSRMGCAATFATVGVASAPGQFTAEATRGVLDLVEQG